MRVGIDTYSFHRMLGALRPGEHASPHVLADGGPAAIRLAVDLGVDVVALQTCFLPAIPACDASDAIDPAVLLDAAAGHELLISWGAPDGLAYGTDPEALADAHRWLDVATLLGSTVMRIVLGGPRLRGLEPMAVRLPRVVPQLIDLAVHAAAAGIRLAIENHGEITATDLRQVVDAVDHDHLGVCFDTANALRVGDDPATAARLLADRVWMLHLKDVEPLDRVVDPVAGPCSMPYGEGVVPLDAVLAALAPAIDAGAPVCIELGQIAEGTEERAAIASGVAWLRAR